MGNTIHQSVVGQGIASGAKPVLDVDGRARYLVAELSGYASWDAGKTATATVDAIESLNMVEILSISLLIAPPGQVGHKVSAWNRRMQFKPSRYIGNREDVQNETGPRTKNGRPNNQVKRHDYYFRLPLRETQTSCRTYRNTLVR